MPGGLSGLLGNIILIWVYSSSPLTPKQRLSFENKKGRGVSVPNGDRVSCSGRRKSSGDG